MNLLPSDEIDFTAYLKATEAQQKVREASVWLDDIKSEVIAPPANDSVVMPWSCTHGTFAFRAGEVTIYAGNNGGGKSLLTGQVALGLIRQGQKVCVASFEMKPKRSIYRMVRQFSGENIDKPRYMDKAKYITELLDRFSAFSSNHLWFYDQQGTTSSQQVIAMARYCAMELGITHVFIDSLMKCVPSEDDYNAQKFFVDEITALARDHNIHIHLIHHIRKLSSEEVAPNKNDIKGTGAIADQVDNVLLVWRNKKKEHSAQSGNSVDEMTADAMLMCEKQRNGENEEWYKLWFHKDSHQFVDTFNSIPMVFDDKGEF